MLGRVSFETYYLLEAITGIVVGLSFGFVSSAFLSKSRERYAALISFASAFSSILAVMAKYGAPLEAIMTFILCSVASLAIGFFSERNTVKKE